MSESNKALVRQMFERADKGDMSLCEDLITSDYVDHNPPPFGSATPGAAGTRETLETATKIFSDWSHEIVQQFSDGDFVITQVIGRGKHTGDFLGIPASNNDVQMEGIAIHRIESGRIAEHWGQVDGVGILVQMGAMPAPGG